MVVVKWIFMAFKCKTFNFLVTFLYGSQDMTNYMVVRLLTLYRSCYRGNWIPANVSKQPDKSSPVYVGTSSPGLIKEPGYEKLAIPA